MKFIIKLFPEITIKSQSVRLRFIKILTGNIRNVLKHYDETLAVVRHWDNIEVRAKDENQRLAIRDALTRIPGIHHILEVEDVPFTDMHDIFEKALVQYRDQLEGKTFCVRVKRRGKHDFSSIDVERYVGGGLNQHIESARVKLTNPDVTVHLEVEDDRLLLIKGRYEGIGGFPIGTQEDVLSLISGGFDSGVSSYMLMRRGCRVHYCFFNLGGAAHEIGVRQVAHYLWNRFGSSHRVRFVAINFEPVVGEILEKIDDGQMGVILKRMMVRAASKVAERYGVQALVTGEALGQVSSQTLTNLRLIDNVSDTLILRPLISYDKEHIINLARQIGTEDFARTMHHITLYIIAFAVATLMLSLGGYAGYKYLVVAAAVSVWWLGMALRGYKVADDRIWARKLFGFSIIAITALSVMMSVDFMVPDSHTLLAAVW